MHAYMNNFLLQFGHFRRKLIEYTFSGGDPHTVNHELDDDEVLDFVRHLAQDKLSLVEEINQYAGLVSEVRGTMILYVPC